MHKPLHPALNCKKKDLSCSEFDLSHKGAGMTYPGEATKNEIQTTKSGLQFIDMTEGTGAAPETGKKVSVHYTGYLLSGKKFDSSVDRNQPFSFTIGYGQVIKGWDEGVATMKIGGKRKLIIPAELGYGKQGAGAVIPPNAQLVFDVELLGVK
jgi:peptidylprolyl isomerase